MNMKLWKNVLTIAWPLIIANSFWNLQLVIDRVFLGMHSTEALAAALAVVGVFWVPMALLQGTASYVTTFVAQYFGAGENDKIGEAVWQAIFIAVAGGVSFLSLNLISPFFYSMVGHSNKIQILEVGYYNSLAFAALPIALVAVVSGFFTGLGETKKVIGINLIGLLLNATFDYTFIFGNFGFEAMGVSGAGFATSLSTYGAATFGMFLLFKSDNELKYKVRSSFSFNFDLLKKFLKFGIPSGLQWSLEGMAFTVFMIIMGRLENGDAALAASSVAVTVMMLSVLPSMGVAQAVMTLVGQKLGKKNPEEAEAITWAGVQISTVYMSLMAVSFLLVPEFYLSWFANNKTPELWGEVSIIAPNLLKFIAVFTMFDSLYLNISFALKGAGDTKFVSLVALITPWPVMVLPAFLVMEWKNAVYWSWGFTALYAFVTIFILYFRFRRGAWKSMSVIES